MNNNDAMPLCIVCKRRPDQIAYICYAASQEKIAPDEFVFRHRRELGLDNRNYFHCQDCKDKLELEE